MNDQNNLKNFFIINNLLTGTNRQAFWKTAAFYLSIFSIVFFMNLLGNSLIIHDKINHSKGFLQDYANYLYVLSFFISTYLFRRLILKFVDTFSAKSFMKDSKNAGRFLNCVKLRDGYINEYEKFFDEQCKIIFLHKRKHRMIFYGVQLSIVVLFMTISVYMPLFTQELSQASGNWNFTPSVYLLGYISSQIKDFIFYVILVPPLIWGITTVAISTIKICKKIDRDNKFDIHPLSPDRSGGLKQLGQLTLILFYIVIVQFSHLFATSLIIGFPISHQIIYPVYFCFTAFLFFYPIGSVRGAMKKAKELELENITQIFHLKYRQFQETANIEPSSEPHNYISDLLEIKTFYCEVDKMPVWPFDIDTLLKFFSLFIIPVVVFVIQLLVDTGSIIYNLDKIKIFENLR